MTAAAWAAGLLLLFLLAGAPPARGATYSGDYYVKATGGTWTTISAAVTALCNASNSVTGAVRVHVENGTYNTGLTVGAISGASATNTITFIADNRWQATVSTSGLPLDLSSSYVTFDGFSFTATGSNTSAVRFGPTAAATNCALRNCYLKGRGHVVEVRNATDTTIYACYIEAGSGAPSGVGVTSGTGYSCSNILIANNCIYGNFGNGPICTEPSATISGYYRCYANTLQNTSTNNGGYAISLSHTNASTVTLKNNIFVRGSNTNAPGYTAYIANAGCVSAIQNNVYWNPGKDASANNFLVAAVAMNFAQWQALGYDTTNGAYADPKLSATAGDLHLNSTRPSPEICLNKGTPLAEVTDDYDLQTRSTSVPEIGADEVNTPPVITESNPASVTMSENSSPVAFALTLNATDADGDTLTWSISGAASHGTATVGDPATGNSMAIGYIPTADYYGPDSFVVQVADGNGGTATITVNVTITAYLAVTLAGEPEVVAVAGGVRLSWATALEMNHAGFEVWRQAVEPARASQSSSAAPGRWRAAGPWRLVSGDGLVRSPAAAADFGAGSEYTYLDATAAPGRWYRYRLADLDAHGARTLHPALPPVRAATKRANHAE